MAKKDKKQYSQTKESDVPQAAAMESKELEAISKLPNDVQEKLKTIKTKLEKFQKAQDLGLKILNEQEFLKLLDNRS